MEVGRSLKYGALAGLLAGLVVGIFIFFVQEPLIDRAICYEQTAGPTCSITEGMVPRLTQKLVDLVGWPIVGFGFGLLYALLFGSFSAYIPGKGPRTKALVLAALAWIVYPILPSLRLAPLPPGVENTMDPNERGLWYGLMALGGAAAIGLGFALYHWLVSRNSTPRGHMMAGIASLPVMVIIAAIPVLAFPGTVLSGNALADPGLIIEFQLVTIAATGILWFVVALVYAAVRSRAERGVPLGVSVGEAAPTSLGRR